MFVRDFQFKGKSEFYEKISGHNLSYYDYNSDVFSQLISLICLRKSSPVSQILDFKKSTDLLGFVRFYQFSQMDWLDRMNATWNGVVEPPFVEVLTNTIFGQAFNMVEMSNLLYENL
jgi:hypothetical protein